MLIVRVKKKTNIISLTSMFLQYSCAVLGEVTYLLQFKYLHLHKHISFVHGDNMKMYKGLKEAIFLPSTGKL